MDSVFLVGMAECLISTVLYGSAFVPLKPFYFGDGIYSLQIRSIAVLVLGVAIAVVRGSIHFYPVVMIGGMFWTIANLIVLPCIGELGLGITVLLYSFTNCLTNWATGYFGLFWTNPRPPTVFWLNYFGLACLLIGGVLIAFIRSVPKPPKTVPSTASTMPAIIGGLDNDVEKVVSTASSENAASTKSSFISELMHGGQARRVIAIGFALLAGFFYGENVTPVVAVQDHPDVYGDVPQDGLSYCFSHYMGIFCTASLIFLVYSIVKRNKPFVSAELTVPSFLSGLIWGVAQTLFIVATKNLSQSVSGPIGAIFPGCVASCWSVFYFKEIRGCRAILMLVASIGVTAVGATCIAVSKNL